MYLRSIFIHSSKLTSLRWGVICQMQVRPGFMERRRRCQISYSLTSEGIGGRACPPSALRLQARRAGTHQAHFAFEHIDKLGQLVGWFVIFTQNSLVH